MNKLAILLVFVLLAGSVHAGLLVGVQAKERVQPVLYANESSEFIVSVFNDSSSPINDVVVRITAQNDLKLIDDLEEVTQVVARIEKIPAQTRERVFVRVQAGQSTPFPQGLLVEYGEDGRFTHSTTSFVTVSEGSLVFTATPIRSVIDQGGKTSISVNARNVGEKPVHQVLIVLDVPAGVEPLGNPIRLDTLAPGQEIADKGLGFEFDPGITGKKVITVRALFQEDGNTHILERRIPIEVGTINPLIFGLVGVVIILIIVAWFQRTRKKE